MTRQSLIERLKICWHVLTKRSYVFFAVGKDALIFDDKGSYDHLDSSKLAAYSDFEEKYLSTNDGIKHISYHIWSAIAAFANEQLHSGVTMVSKYGDWTIEKVTIPLDKVEFKCIQENVSEKGPNIKFCDNIDEVLKVYGEEI